MSEELKPCPFCGAHSDAVRAFPRTCNKDTPYNATDRAYPLVRCLGCGASQDGSDWTGVETAVAKWNHRATPPAAVAVPEGMVLVRRKLIDESIARINCAIPGWEVHVHALNDALAAAPAAPSVRAVVVPAGIDRIGLHGFLCEALDDGRCIADAYRFKDGYHTARNAKVMALTDKLLAMLAAAPASPAATGPVPVLLPVVPTAPILGVLNEMLTNCHSVEESYADLRRAAAAPSADGEG